MEVPVQSITVHIEQFFARWNANVDTALTFDGVRRKTIRRSCAAEQGGLIDGCIGLSVSPSTEQRVCILVALVSSLRMQTTIFVVDLDFRVRMMTQYPYSVGQNYYEVMSRIALQTYVHEDRSV